MLGSSDDRRVAIVTDARRSTETAFISNVRATLTPELSPAVTGDRRTGLRRRDQSARTSNVSLGSKMRIYGCTRLFQKAIEKATSDWMTGLYVDRWYYSQVPFDLLCHMSPSPRFMIKRFTAFGSRSMNAILASLIPFAPIRYTLAMPQGSELTGSDLLSTLSSTTWTAESEIDRGFLYSRLGISWILLRCTGHC
jgi:hypothetical protein